MCISMSKTIKEERLRWVLPIAEKQINLSDAVKVCPYGQRTLERWIAAYKKGGASALEPKSTRPKSHPGETPIKIKRRVIELRKRKKLCALKLKWELETEGIVLHERTVGKIIKTEGLVRKYRVRRVKYKYLRALRKPGELLEIDVKHVPQRINGKKFYQFTAIDTSSRWRYLAIYDDESSYSAIKFLEEVLKRFPYPVLAVKTDNGTIFTNYYMGCTRRSDMTVKTVHAFDRFCSERGIVHYLIDAGKPAQNGTVERSHREDQEKFYERNDFHDAGDLRQKIRRWNMRYNDLRHCGLNGKTPNQSLISYSLTEPPKVRT